MADETNFVITSLNLQSQCMCLLPMNKSTLHPYDNSMKNIIRHPHEQHHDKMLYCIHMSSTLKIATLHHDHDILHPA